MDRFYEPNLGNELRLGDVVRGYIIVSPTLKSPLFSPIKEDHNYKLDIESPQYCAILTPCCSIESGSILLTPLIKIRKDFLKTPKFEADLTNINRKMVIQESIPPEEWEKIEPARQQEILSTEPEYKLLSIFIYKANDIFARYTLHGNEISEYMIDFKNIFTVKCPLIQRAGERKKEEMDVVLSSKVLQLTVGTRYELREKLSFYFSRPSPEDRALLGN
jgi:hypothetical protein